FGDERNALLYKYVLFIEALQPDAFIFENVSNFRSGLKTEDGVLDAPALLSEAIESLSGNHLHYEVGSGIVKMKMHAIPQDRDRFIMFGVNRQRVSAPHIVQHFFDLPSFTGEIPLNVALIGLEQPGIFAQSSEGTDSSHTVRAYTLIDAT